MKLLNITTGKPGDRHHAQVEFEGNLTPTLAVKAAKKAFGHANGVTVTDTSTGISYRCTNDKARLVK